MAAPVVNSVNPTSGPPAGATPVTITGVGFTGATAVTFGGVAATAVVVVSDTSITCTTPAGAPGLVAIAVTTPGGTGTSFAIFDYTGILFSNFPVMRTSGIGIDKLGNVWLYRSGKLINVGIPPSWTPGLMEAASAEESESESELEVPPPPSPRSVREEDNRPRRR
jgi:hypothetical protein